MTQADQRPNKNKLLLRYPASWWHGLWREGLPSGNGKLGASVLGGIQEETVLLQHSELWHWGHKDQLPDVSHTLAETRQLMDEERYSEASWHLTRAVQERGYAAKLASRFPLAALTVRMSCNKAFREYRRELDMDTGEVLVRWRDGRQHYFRRLFVSRADDCVVYELDCREQAAGDHANESGELDNGKLEGTLGLQFHQGDRLREDEAFKALEQSVTVQTAGDYIYYAGRNDNGRDFGAVLRLVQVEEERDAGVVPASKPGIIAGNGSGNGNMDNGELHFRSFGKLLILVKMFATGDREPEWARLKQELSVLSADYGELLASHTALHQPLFRSASLELDDAEDDGRCNEELLLEAYEGEAPTGLVRKLWAYGRYLFISGTSEQSQPFGLYGLWGGDYRLIWGHNMANENVQMMYWHAAVGGLSRLSLSLFRYYNTLMDDFRDNARKLYGCGGIYIPAGTTPGIGVPNQVVPVIMNWTGAAGWLARHYYEYYQYTGDEQFLRNEALPFMTEALRFYEDFLVLDEDGRYKIYPSVSPENTPQNFMPKHGQQLAHPMPTAINATMDIAIIKELLQHVIEASRITATNSGELQRWEAMLDHMPPYQINDDGSVREWLHPAFDDRRNHRHLSHLYPVFPGQEVTREEQPKLFQAFETAVHQRLIGAQSGWSLAHMASIYARLGEGDRALESLDTLSRSCLLNNGFTLHNDWRNMGVCMPMPTAPVQLDANLGWVNAVQEMLLFVSPQWIKLLPALPARWKKGAVRDWCVAGGKISFAWDCTAGTFSAELSASRRIATKLQLPGWITVCKLHGEGDGFGLSSCADGSDGSYELVLEAGGRLAVESPDFESWSRNNKKIAPW